MTIKKPIRPSKVLPKHEADPLLCAPTAAEMKRDGHKHANFFFWLDGAHRDDPKRYFLKFTEDECRRWAYLFEQAADRMAGRVVFQSDDRYEVQDDRVRGRAEQAASGRDEGADQRGADRCARTAAGEGRGQAS